MRAGPSPLKVAAGAVALALAAGAAALGCRSTKGPPSGAPAEMRCPEGMVLIPAGVFQMGSDADADPRFGLTAMGPAATSRHPVSLSAYCLDRTEVTVAQYRRCVKEPRARRSCAPAPTKERLEDLIDDAHEGESELCNGDRSDRDTHPVNCVDWALADAYCRWAGGQLPTEAQWEYAAAGSEGRSFAWGEAMPGPSLLNGCGSECRAAWNRKAATRPSAQMRAAAVFRSSVMYEGDDGWEDTAPVGSYPAGNTPLGLSDMMGNVWEWTADWRGPYGPGAALVVDPKGPDAPSEKDWRAVRGGSFSTVAGFLVTATSRGATPASARSSNTGFRCARRPGP